ncbi:HK97-gp10 family putative phage morphogenesis protein [Trueperella pyogenes]|uniref:HK97-gp10 family putative phage morphogenesis protein n=1 Tax=Trueperella pyogenes TaxID=1661 RepID=UPI00345D72E6
MARASVKFPSKILDELDALGGRLDDHAEAALKAGAAVVEPVMRTNLAGSIRSSNGTGQLLGALGITTVKTDRRGNHNIKVGFDEPRRDGTINAKIAAILEYGSSRQPARPFLAATRRATRARAVEAMKAVLTTRMGGGS